MTKVERLINEAKDSCKFRGHTMERFDHYENGLAHSRCIHCQRAVGINANPMPNQTEIAGGAVALNCPWALISSLKEGTK